MNSQNNAPPSEACNSIAMGPEKSSLAKHKKDFKIQIMIMCKGVKEDMNKCFNKDHKTQTNGWMR